MLIARSELAYNFKGARFRLEDARDRALLAWVFNQFLYGEVTGIQCGYWLYRAPHLNAAAFLARQAGEEISHVKRMLRILELLGEKPAPAHWAVRFLSTGMMGGSWGEHTTIEMALGEGLVLSAFYALADTIDQPEIHKILESAVLDEEKHVEFGEREAREWLSAHPGDRKMLLGVALQQRWGLTRVRSFALRRLAGWVGADHPVMREFDGYYAQALATWGRRIELLGLTGGRPLSSISPLEQAFLMVSAPARKFWRRVPIVGRRDSKKLLTDTYLSDPVVRGSQGGGA